MVRNSETILSGVKRVRSEATRAALRFKGKLIDAEGENVYSDVMLGKGFFDITRPGIRCGADVREAHAAGGRRARCAVRRKLREEGVAEEVFIGEVQRGTVHLHARGRGTGARIGERAE